jgi:hypothetical protein
MTHSQHTPRNMTFPTHTQKRHNSDSDSVRTLQEGVPSDGQRHLATWLNERHEIDACDAQAHPHATEPENAVNAVNNNHIK